MHILLIDDLPTYFYDRSEADIMLKRSLKKYFTLSWLQNPAETKAFYEWIEEKHLNHKFDWNKFNLPFDIIIFDYSLTEGKPTNFRGKGISSNIFEKIKKIDNRAFELEANEIGGGIIPELDNTNDRVGLYLGIAISKSFKDYPIGIVPTTGSAIVKNSDAAIFEWVNMSFVDDKFSEKIKVRHAPKWDDLLKEGVIHFKKRFEELIGANKISVNNFDKILNGDSQHITFSTIYGERHVNLHSLFFYENENNRDYKIKNWLNIIKNKFDEHRQ